MPNRIIRESALLSETLASLSAGAERLFWRLTVAADDFGRFYAGVAQVRGRCLPLVKCSDREVEAWLHELATAGAIAIYHSDGKAFLRFVNWLRYQTVRNKSSKFPAPADTCEQLPANENNFDMVGSSPNTNTYPDSVSESESDSAPDPDPDPEPEIADAPKAEDLAALWDEAAPQLTPARIPLSVNVRCHAGVRLSERTLAQWREIFARANASPFLRGETTDFHATFGWAMERRNFADKVLEGRYDAKQARAAPRFTPAHQRLMDEINNSEKRNGSTRSGENPAQSHAELAPPAQRRTDFG